MNVNTHIHTAAGDVLRMVQFTDCHLGELPGQTLLNLDTDESFADVVQTIAEREAALDLLVCTGDIANSGNPACYDRFYKTLKQQFDVPLAWLPGNHDSATNMREFAADKTLLENVLESEHWRLILLDSAVPGQVYGKLAEAELARLAQLLESTDKHILVMLHHQPQPVGSAWIDQYTLRNAEPFFELIDACERVKGVSWGHVHQAYEADRNGKLLCSAPSTCIQFKPDLDDFTVDRAMPGYRWFNLHSDGSIDTGVERIAKKDYPIDYSSNGY